MGNDSFQAVSTDPQQNLYGFSTELQFLADDIEFATRESRARRDNYSRYWNMYIGNHWGRKSFTPNYYDRNIYEDRDAFEGSDPVTDVQANYIKTILDKILTFIAGKEIVPLYLPEREEVLKPVVSRILEDTNIEEFTMSLFQSGAVTGDAYIHVVWDNKAHFGKGGPVLRLLDSSTVMPIYRNINSSNVMERVIVEAKDRDHKEDLEITRYYIFTDTMVHVVERKKQEEPIGTGYVSSNKGSRSSLYTYRYLPEESRINVLGTIPIIHIRNFPIATDPFGRSDVANLQHLNKLYNSILMQFYQCNQLFANPVTVAKGCDASQIQAGPNKTYSIPAEGDLQYLEPRGTSLHEVTEETVRNLLYTQGNVPEKSVGQDQHISNTSGVALSIAYLPITEAVFRKRLFYRKGIEEALQLALLMESLVGEGYSFAGATTSTGEPVSFDTYPANYIKIKFQDFLPKDRTEELNQIMLEMQLGLESRKGAMERLGVSDISGKTKEVSEDKVLEFSLEAQLINALNDGTIDVTEQNSIDKIISKITAKARGEEGDVAINEEAHDVIPTD